MENLLFENIRIAGGPSTNLMRLIPMGPDDPGMPAKSAATTQSTTVPTSNPYRQGFGRRLVVPGEGPYIHNVAFKDVEIYGEHARNVALPLIYLEGLNRRHDVNNVTFQNVVRFGKLLTSDSAEIHTGNFVANVRVSAADN